MSKIKPDVFALGNDDKSIEEKRVLIEKYGGKLILIDRSDHGFISTTDIEQKIKNS
jgi:bifunctional ADP-heptose synthase (sugar kinase/adenylyltransferase)